MKIRYPAWFGVYRTVRYAALDDWVIVYLFFVSGIDRRPANALNAEQDLGV